MKHGLRDIYWEIFIEDIKIYFQSDCCKTNSITVVESTMLTIWNSLFGIASRLYDLNKTHQIRAMGEANNNSRRSSNQSGVYEQYELNQCRDYNEYHNPFKKPAKLESKNSVWDFSFF